MAISPMLLMQVKQHCITVSEQRASEPAHPPAVAIEEMIERIPAIIAQAQADGSSYATVMTLIDGRDFGCPTWKDRRFSKSPKVSWLTQTAAAVFAYCDESGLQPFLSPFHGGDRRESGIVVQWDAARLHDTLCCGADASYVERVSAVTAAARAIQAAKLMRERVKKVRQTIAEMHHAIDRAAAAGATEVKVAELYARGPNEDLRGDSVAGDIIKYCESLELVVRIETWKNSSPRFSGEAWFAYIYAGWPNANGCPQLPSDGIQQLPRTMLAHCRPSDGTTSRRY